MPNKHKNPMIAWHSADPAAKPWVKAEAKRRGITERELLDEALIEYRILCELRGKVVIHEDGDPRNNDPSNLEIREIRESGR
jgi:hypothetical protein